MANATTNAKPFQEAAGVVADKAKDVAGTVADRTREAAGTVADKAKDAFSTATDRAKDAGKSAVNMADNATARVGHGIENAADRLREKGPHDGMMGAATSKVADTLEKGGRYLEREGISGMAEDLTGLIKRNPIPALLIGLGVGYLIGAPFGVEHGH